MPSPKKPKRSEARDWWPINEEAALVADCALRFDGGKLEEELTPRGEVVTVYQKLVELQSTHYDRSFQILDDVKHNMGVFFLLQRAGKWLDWLEARNELLYVWLFIHLHEVEVPRGYENPEYVRAYEANRERAAALAHRLRPQVEKAIQAWERRKS